MLRPASSHGVVPLIRYWIVYIDTVPPDVGADQERDKPFDVTDDAARADGCPGAAVAEFPALIDAKIVAPTE